MTIMKYLDQIKEINHVIKTKKKTFFKVFANQKKLLEKVDSYWYQI